MKMLPKVAHLKRYIAHQFDNNESLNSLADSDSQLLVKQTTEIESAPVDSSSLNQENNPASANQPGEMVKCLLQCNRC